MAPGKVFVVAALAALVIIPSAFGALPRRYDVQKIDAPTPEAKAFFGLGMVNAGDLNGDGKDDLVIGSDERGGGGNTVFVLSGADGSVIRTIEAPDPGGQGMPASFGSHVGSIPSLTADGVRDILVTAVGVDVPIPGTDKVLVDAGRAYLFDGATGALLERLDMPASDLQEQFDVPTGPAKPAFGRSILNPANRSANGLAVQIGDVNGGGKPDIVVGASDYYETGATANPLSPCAQSGAVAQCLQAGRVYVYYGESLHLSSEPGLDNTPDLVMKNPTAQPDDLESSVNIYRESMGFSIAPVGDIGRCLVDFGPGAYCRDFASTKIPDGKPDLLVSSHRTDEFGMFDVGVVYLVDGSTGSILYTYHHPEPQPASIFGFANYNQPAVGDVAGSTAPDVVIPAMRQNNPYTGGGTAFVMNGDFKQPAGPNDINLATLHDPTPQQSENFGGSISGFVDVNGDGKNEVLVGAMGPRNPATNQGVINDVHIQSPIGEQELKTIPDPDQQPGSEFGSTVTRLGDVNADGFEDFAVGAGLFDGQAVDQGRVYIFRSNNNPPTRTISALTPSKRVVKPGEPVVLRGKLISDEASCLAGQPVELQRLVGRSWRHVLVAVTIPSGEFEFNIRPLRTRLYRAHAFKGACPAVTSPTVSVRVKR